MSSAQTACKCVACILPRTRSSFLVSRSALLCSVVARTSKIETGAPTHPAWVLDAESYGFTTYDLCTLSGGHAFGLSASTNPQVRPACASPPTFFAVTP